jgi:hypothetical protein
MHCQLHAQRTPLMCRVPCCALLPMPLLLLLLVVVVSGAAH